MIKLIRTNSSNEDFINLVAELDAYLKEVDGEEHSFYNQFNHIDVLQHTVVAYFEDTPVGCGAFKPFDNDSVEIKRMYLQPTYRGSGIASKILEALEVWAKELNYNRCVLETGQRQIEAVQFYQKLNYKPIPNYGQYIGIDNSRCFEKKL